MFARTSLAILICLACTRFARAQSIAGRWSLTWADEFNKPSDLDGWTRQTGSGGWGNNEVENYTDSPANAFVLTDPSSGNGVLTIRTIVSGPDKKTYTSARLNSSKLFSQTGGLFEFRAKLPKGQGLWPAIWMMPRDHRYGEWPRSGEIDVLESLGQETTLVQGSLHSGDSASAHIIQTKKLSQTGKQPVGFSTTDWHTYDLEWSAGNAGKPTTLNWYVDGILYESLHNGWHVPQQSASPAAPFDQPFYILLNLAVGGSYGGEPKLSNGNYDMLVDYVRVYQNTMEATTLPSSTSK